MRARACTILCIGTILIAAPAWAAGGRYDPDYPVCMEGITSDGTRLDCIYMSIEQCKQGSIGTSGTCFDNPGYVPRPAEAAPASTEPELPLKPKKNMGRYDPDYAVCMEVYGAEGSRIECSFTSMEQCKLGTTGTAGTCFNNPYYVPPAAEAAPQTEPVPPVKPAKTPKSSKSAKPAKLLPSPPSPPLTQSQQR